MVAFFIGMFCGFVFCLIGAVASGDLYKREKLTKMRTSLQSAKDHLWDLENQINDWLSEWEDDEDEEEED